MYQTLLTPLLVALGVAMIVATILRALRRAELRRSAAGDTRQPCPPAPPPLVDDLRDAAIRIEEVSREYLSRLDTKIRMLRQLLDEADARIAELRRLDRTNGGTTPDLHRRIWALADQGLSAREISERTGHPQGEVELVLGLRGLKPPATG
jgi:hypothetical protein